MMACKEEIIVESVGGIDVDSAIDLLFPLLGKHLVELQEEKLKQHYEQASSNLPTFEQGSE